jgi:hypothetical protein
MNNHPHSTSLPAGHCAAGANHLPRVLMLVTCLLLVLSQASLAEPGRESVVITGDSAGASCQRVAVGLVKYQLHYSWFGGIGGWNRSISKVTDMRAELYVYDSRARRLSKMLKIAAPRKAV